MNSRIKVFYQNNKVVGVAQNETLEQLGGEHLAFVDSNNYISSDMYSGLLEVMNRESAGIASCAECWSRRKGIFRISF